jgi:NADP-dependent 3-hydroxy acid dehydrogenase YdfG
VRVAGSGAVRTAVVDVRDNAAQEQAVQQHVGAFGCLDLVVLNAGGLAGLTRVDAGCTAAGAA